MMRADDETGRKSERESRRNLLTRASGRALVASVAALVLGAGPARAQESPRVVDLTLERMVELAVNDSYRVRQLNLAIERTRHRLRAEQAGLRSSVDLEVSAPELESISDTRWNSTLGRNEIVHENSRRWEAELSVEQPVIVPFLGYPTNGYLSFNNRVYRYLQLEEDGDQDLRYYNRYYVEYRQPLFQPNELKNDLDEAELDLEGAELDFQDDIVDLVNDLSRGYFDLFDDMYRRVIYADQVERLEEALDAATEVASGDPARGVEVDQLQVELANAREQLQQSRSRVRLRSARLKQELGLEESDSLALDPVLDIEPVEIDEERAIEYGATLSPALRNLDLSRRQDRIRLENTEGRNSFRMDVELSYGREMQDPRFQQLWGQPRNSYTVDVTAYVPIWDWGQRDERIAAQRIEVARTELRIEEAEAELVSDIRNEVRNVEEYESRALAMQENLELARQVTQSTLERYRDGSATVLDLAQSVRREVDTARNLLDAYLSWQRAMLRLQRLTFYDFQLEMPVLERYGIQTPTDGGSPDT